MDFMEIAGYLGSALGGGGLATLFNWRYNKKKHAADVKSDEIDNMRKAMEDFYKPLVDQQNKRIHQLEDEVSTLRKQLTSERDEHQRQIKSLQQQIVEITRVLGIRANNQIRDEKTGRYVKKNED